MTSFHDAKQAIYDDGFSKGQEYAASCREDYPELARDLDQICARDD